MKIKVFTLLLSVFAFQLVSANMIETNVVVQKNDSITKNVVLPQGTILFLKASTDVNARNFKEGDHFFVELDKPVTSKGQVIVPKGTIVQMDVLESVDNKRTGSSFAITVGGFIIDNYLQKVSTEAKKVVTEGKARGTLARAAIGAGVGAAFDGGSGAGKGAAIGGATGMLSPGQAIYFPKGTEATFQLSEPLTVNWL
jgi:hypothetical protein